MGMIARTKWYQITFADVLALLTVLAVMYAFRRDRPSEFVVGSVIVVVVYIIISRLLYLVARRRRNE
jgi:hypothetical protein